MVSTPQDVALKDAVRGVQMFQKVNVKVKAGSLFNFAGLAHTAF